MRKIAFVFFTVFVIIMLTSCGTKFRWLDIVQSDLTLIYDDNNSMTETEKIINQEAGFITYRFLNDVPKNRNISCFVKGDDCIKFLVKVDGIQITPTKEGKAIFSIVSEDTRYGSDIVHITVIKKSSI